MQTRIELHFLHAIDNRTNLDIPIGIKFEPMCSKQARIKFKYTDLNRRGSDVFFKNPILIVCYCKVNGLCYPWTSIHQWISLSILLAPQEKSISICTISLLICLPVGFFCLLANSKLHSIRPPSRTGILAILSRSASCPSFAATYRNIMLGSGMISPIWDEISTQDELRLALGCTHERVVCSR